MTRTRVTLFIAGDSPRERIRRIQIQPLFRLLFAPSTRFKRDNLRLTRICYPVTVTETSFTENLTASSFAWQDSAQLKSVGYYLHHNVELTPASVKRADALMHSS